MSEVKRVEREIEQLEIIRDNLTRHIKRLREYRDRMLRPARVSTPGVRKVVSAIQLRPFIRRWIELHEMNYDTKGLYAIAERCRVSHHSITNILGDTIPNNTGVPQEWVSLEQVDKILSGMEMNHVFHQLEIVEIKWPPRKNGKWIKTPEPPFTHYEEE
jgi:hypothetical protein